jgi:hypothetical protein
MNTVLLLAPDRAGQSLFGTALQMAGFSVKAADTVHHVRAALRSGEPRAVVVEHPVPGLLTPAVLEAMTVLSEARLPTLHLLPASVDAPAVQPRTELQALARLPVRPAVVVDMVEQLIARADSN